MADTVFLSGACGFLGTEIAHELLNQPECRVYVLVRGNPPILTIMALAKKIASLL